MDIYLESVLISSRPALLPFRSLFDFRLDCPDQRVEERQRIAGICGELAKLKFIALQRESKNEFHEEEEFNIFLKKQKDSENHSRQENKAGNLDAQKMKHVENMLREEQTLNSVLQKKLKKIQDENLELQQRLNVSSSSQPSSSTLDQVISVSLPPITDFGVDEDDEDDDKE